MPDISNAEKIAWQRQAHALLGRLLELAAKESLPAVAWTVADTGATLTGQFFARPPALRRERYAAWKAAITTATGSAPDHDYEHELSGGETRLVAQWERVPVRPGERYPTVRVAISASIWADDEDEENENG